MSNTFGRLFRLTTFGESHGAAIGGIVDGMPSGIRIDTDFVQHELDRRRPGASYLVSPRSESDRVTFLSGLFEGRTTGTPIGFILHNERQRSSDYAELAQLFRPSHADYTYQQKYGLRDPRGGGRASARETACRVVGGALAKMALQAMGVTVTAYTSQVGNVRLEADYRQLDLSLIEQHAVRCPDPDVAAQMEALIVAVRAKGDTVGGTVSGVIRGCPVGWGEPLFGKLHAALGGAMLSIPAAKGFDYGSGFDGLEMYGSQLNDAMYMDHGRVAFASNHSGGIQGGISNGEDIYFRVAFKPVPTLPRPQRTVTASGADCEITARGRHDTCVLPRAVPVVEAMAALTLLDFYLQAQAIGVAERLR